MLKNVPSPEQKIIKLLLSNQPEVVEIGIEQSLALPHHKLYNLSSQMLNAMAKAWCSGGPGLNPVASQQSCDQYFALLKILQGNGARGSQAMVEILEGAQALKADEQMDFSVCITALRTVAPLSKNVAALIGPYAWEITDELRERMLKAAIELSEMDTGESPRLFEGFIAAIRAYEIG